jgi:hypothetical protein
LGPTKAACRTRRPRTLNQTRSKSLHNDSSWRPKAGNIASISPTHTKTDRDLESSSYQQTRGLLPSTSPYIGSQAITQPSSNHLIQSPSKMSTSTATTPRTSISDIKAPITSSSSVYSSDSTLRESSKAKSIWSQIKRHAKEHHESVNAAYVTYYGHGQGQLYGKQEVWEYRR